MSDCSDSRFERMLHAYELGMLKGKDLEDFELHLYECDHCFQRVEKLHEASHHLRHNPAAEVLVRRAAEELERTEAGETSQRGAKRRFLSVFRVSLVAAAIALLLILKPWHFEFRPTHEAIAMEDHIAILYFDNFADPTDSSRLGEMVTTLLITDLSESEYVSVMSSQRLYDIMKQLGKEGERNIDKNIATEVAERAKAKWMLTGSIMEDEDTLIITCQIADVTTGQVVASQRVMGRNGDRIFALVDSLTVEVKRDLSLPQGAMKEIDRAVADMTSYSAEAYGYFLEGAEYLNKFFYSEAKVSLENAIEIDSTLAIAYYLLFAVESYLQRGTNQLDILNKAMANLDHASEKDKYLIRAASFKQKGEYAAAIGEYEKMVNRYPDEKEGYYGLALLYKWTLGDQETAVRYFEKTIELDSLCADPYSQLSYDYRQIGEPGKSYWAVNKYIALRPEEPNPYCIRGDLYFYDGKYDKAIESYRLAYQKKTGFEDAVYGIGDSYLREGSPDSADVWFRKHLHSPEAGERAFGRLALAHIPLWQGKLRETLKVLERGILEDKADGYEGEWHTHKLILKALACMELGEADSALFYSARGVDQPGKVHGDDLVVFTVRAWVLSRVGNFTEAKLLIRDIESEHRHQEELALASLSDVKGVIEFFDGNHMKAAEHFRRSLEQRKQWQISYLLTQWMLARSYLESGQRGEAAAEFESLLSKNWHSYSFWSFWLHKTHYYLGITYEKSGWKAQAIEQYQKYLRIMNSTDLQISEVDDARERVARLSALP